VLGDRFYLEKVVGRLEATTAIHCRSGGKVGPAVRINATRKVANQIPEALIILVSRFFGDERPIPEERVSAALWIHFEPGWSLAHQCSCGSRGRYSSSNLGMVSFEERL